jgi:hypothetical protein
MHSEVFQNEKIITIKAAIVEAYWNIASVTFTFIIFVLNFKVNQKSLSW